MTCMLSLVKAYGMYSKLQENPMKEQMSSSNSIHLSQPNSVLITRTL